MSESEETLTLEELAMVVDGRGGLLGHDAARRLGKVLGSDPRFADQVATLESMAAVAAIEGEESPDRLSDAVAAHLALDSLLAADSWRHPAEVLDPDGGAPLPYAVLIHLAEERVGDRQRLDQVRERLQEALAAEQAEERLLEKFVAGLLELPKDRADALVLQALRVYVQRSPG